MLYTSRNGKIQTNSIEYSVSYHCNLRCYQCSHLSPLMKAHFPPVDGFRDDLLHLSEVLHARVLRLLGGEPLLNPEIDKFVAIAKQSGIADMVMVTTNGLLLHRMSEDFWKNADAVLVCLYPDVPLKGSYTSFKQRAKVHNTLLWFHLIDTFRTTIVSEPHHMDWITALIYKTCKDAHLHHCHMIHEGMLYKCAVPPFLSRYLDSRKRPYDPIPDGISIHDNRDLAGGLESYLMEGDVKESCRYCLGSLGKRIPHRQLPDGYPADSGIAPIPVQVTRENSLDYKILAKEASCYLARRLVERLAGKKKW